MKTVSQAIVGILVPGLLVLAGCTSSVNSLNTPWFEDMSSDKGIGSSGSDSEFGRFGVLWLNADRDSWTDLVFMNHGQAPSFLFNKGGGSFEDRFAKSGLRIDRESPDFSEQWDRHGAACGDYDNDGDPDLFIAHGADKGQTVGLKRDELARNEGNGKFTDVTLMAGVENSRGRARTPSWIDYDNDGYLDLYIGNMQSSNVLYQNNGDGSFSKVPNAAGLRTWKEGAAVRQAWADYDKDGRIDALLVKPVALLKNGNGGFQNVTRSAGIGKFEVPQAMAIAWGDFNSDTYMDFFLTSKETGGSALYTNKRDGSFDRFKGKGKFGPEKGAVGFGAEWGDIDNDGDLDLMIAYSNEIVLYENRGGRLQRRLMPTFKQIEPGRHSDLALGDWNGDGYLDMAFQTPSQNYLFQNRLSGNHWLKIILEGEMSNRSGFGTKVIAKTSRKTIFREYTGASGTYFSTGCGPIHMGLGDTKRVNLELRWPSGVKQSIHDVRTDQLIRIHETEGISVVRP